MKSVLLALILAFSACASPPGATFARQRSIHAIKASTVKVQCEGGHGSGTIIGHTPLSTIVLTADHVADGCEGMTVNGLQVGKVVRNKDYDIALVWVPGWHGPAAKIRKPMLGEHVTVAGYPADRLYENSPFTITAGAVSAFVEKGIFKTDAFLAPGVSGGGAWGEDGKLVGVATHGFGGSSGWAYYCFQASLALAML